MSSGRFISKFMGAAVVPRPGRTPRAPLSCPDSVVLLTCEEGRVSWLPLRTTLGLGRPQLRWLGDGGFLWLEGKGLRGGGLPIA